MSSGPKNATVGATPTSARAKTIQLSSKTSRLPYARPIALFLPLVVLVLFFTYLSFCVDVDAKGKHVVLLERVRDIAAEPVQRDQDMVADRMSSVPISFKVFQVVEERVAGAIFRMSFLLFGGLSGMRMACTLAWLVHFYELGVCFRICRACNASFWVTVAYMCCTLVGGFTQLMILKREEKKWLGKARATAADAHATTDDNISRKNQ